MKGAIKEAGVAFLRLRERLARTPTEYVFVLGHMRSGSSLLHHILVSHPDLLGCGERNAAYNTADDLYRLHLAARRHRRAYWRSYRYLVDQINHDRFVPRADFLNRHRIRTVFLIREPVGALSSMVRVLGKHYGMTLEEAVEYYGGRLERLVDYAQALDDPERGALVTFNALVERVEPTLAQLQRFLGLQTGFSPNYQVFDFTGKRGDPGLNIRQGAVLRPALTESLDIPPGRLGQAQDAYDETLQRLRASVAYPGL
jgi:hypothetical protein